MINQVSNNKSSGTLHKECDAGTPISGKTANNRYQILKLNIDGTLAGFPTLTNTIADIGNNPISVPLVPGAPPANTFLGSGIASGPALEDGIYRINPTFIFEGGTGGGISIVLYKVGTPLDAFISTLPPYNAFNPTMIDLQYGLYGYWHNSATENLGSVAQIAYNRNNAIELQITYGLYKFAIITEGAVTITSGVGYFGYWEFLKIA